MSTPIHTPTSARPGDADEAVELTVVAPVLFGEGRIGELHRRIADACRALGVPCETLTVGEGSRERTFAILQGLAGPDPRSKLLRVGRSLGQKAAMSAGLDVSQGEVIVWLDGDLRNDPADIALPLGTKLPASQAGAAAAEAARRRLGPR